MISDADIAWLLADTTACLASQERTMVFVELGCGEDRLAIERILKAVVSNQIALPRGVLATLTDWLDGHAGSPEEPRLRRLIANIRPQQLEAVSPPCDVGGQVRPGRWARVAGG